MSEYWIPFIGAGIAGLAAFLGARIQGRIVGKKVDVLHVEINSRMTQLIQAMITAALVKERAEVAERDKGGK